MLEALGSTPPQPALQKLCWGHLSDTCHTNIPEVEAGRGAQEFKIILTLSQFLLSQPGR